MGVVIYTHTTNKETKAPGCLPEGAQQRALEAGPESPSSLQKVLDWLTSSHAVG